MQQEDAQRLDRYEDVAKCLGSTFDKVLGSKILVVGTGGIGCELLKNLVLSGFSDLEIVDLDTIDYSNLNRQFLFHKKHVGKSKAEVARDSALSFNPHVKIVAHYSNIKMPEFGPQYFKQFSIVMNALDNLEARRHVNRMCLAADVPLIESGTAGYLGQITVIKKGQTECFECLPKAAPKVYAVCTIRNSPTKPIHCIVWAKFLFSQLFGEGEEEDVMDIDEEKSLEEITEDHKKAGTEVKSEVGEEAQQLFLMEKKKAKEFLDSIKKDHPFNRWLFEKAFNTDIKMLSLVGKMIASNKPKGVAPTASDKPEIKPLLIDQILQEELEKEETDGNTLPEQRVWSLRKNFDIFMDRATKLKERSEKEQLSFDKDDRDIMDFVTSASNLRSHIFGIPLSSRFDTKAKAGNIIPAIATTNAIISGLMVMEAFKILEGKADECKSAFLLRAPSNKRFILTANIEKPNPECYVCGSNWIQVQINVKTTTMDYFVERVLKDELCMQEPSVTLPDGSILYDTELGIINKDKILCDKEINICDNSIVTVSDALQDLDIEISIVHCEQFENSEKLFIVEGKAQVKKKNTTEEKGKEMEEDDEDDVVIVEPHSVNAADSMVVEKPLSNPSPPKKASKRKREPDTVETPVLKRGRVETSNSEN